MSNNKLIIPKKIKVGFQNRTGTYSGTLAYVIWYDHKGILRKETGWNSWRDKKIEPQEFVNEPTEGFVLNKKVGGYKSDWNFRQAYSRIYDPRGFEFEITIENLLFILEECSSIKGKGIEGQLVYSWDKDKLVLLPVSSQNYKESATFTNLQTLKVPKSEMVAGHTYLLKDTTEVLYLGREETFEIKNYPNYNYNTREYDYKRLGSFSTGKKHVFVNLNKKKEYEPNYLCFKDFSKISKRLSEDISIDFAGQFDKFKKSTLGSIYNELITEVTKKTLLSFSFALDYNKNPYYNDFKKYSLIDGKICKVSVGSKNENYYSYQNDSRPLFLLEEIKINESGVVSMQPFYSEPLKREDIPNIEILQNYAVEISLKNKYNKTVAFWS